MDKKTLVILVAFIFIIGLIMGLAYMFSDQLNGGLGDGQGKKASEKVELVKKSSSKSVEISPIQEELNQMSAQMVADLQAEQRLNLDMFMQLRSYQGLLKHIQSYAKEVERDIKIIEEISSDEFQKDVKLQASLFSGKKPQLVAKHLEEFRAGRVGAILAKMKQKEASAVLDVWAKNKDPRVSLFYRETIASYLNNKRRDENPELFNKLSSGTVAEGKPAKKVASR